mgnify:CR=1 FL=1
MSIIINLSVILADKNVKSKDLAKAIGITEQNLSILKNNRAKAIRFTTLEAICKELNCQPGDIIKIKKNIEI